MKEELTNLITETAERIVIDYANFSGRDIAHRAEFREVVDKHLKALFRAFLEAEIEYRAGMKKDMSEEEKRSDSKDMATILRLTASGMKKIGYNQAINEQIAYDKELLERLKI